MNSFTTLCPHDLPVVQLLSCIRLFATPGTVACCQTSLSSTVSQSLPKLISIESVMPSNHLILCHPLLLLPSIFPIIRVFSNESTLHIRWPKYSSFNFSICPCGLATPQKAPLSNTLTLIRFQHMDTGGTDLVFSSDLVQGWRKEYQESKHANRLGDSSKSLSSSESVFFSEDTGTWTLIWEL